MFCLPIGRCAHSVECLEIGATGWETSHHPTVVNAILENRKCIEVRNHFIISKGDCLVGTYLTVECLLNRPVSLGDLPSESIVV